MDSRQLQLVLKLQDQASSELRKVNGELEGAEQNTKNWDGALRKAKQAVLAIGAAAVGALGYGVKIAADLETAEVGLTTLLGSADEARETIKRLKIEAARTPFELPGLTQATQLLTSVTKDGDESIDILLDVGEALAAMGKGQSELDRIIVNLQQIAATGKAAAIDVKQFAFAGIPIYEMLEETTGKTGEAVAQMVTDGEISFEMLTKMFDEANDAGGRFFNAFQNQSGTFNQAWSNMKDSVGIALADIAVNYGLLDNLSSALMKVSDVVANYPEYFNNAREAASEFFTSMLDSVDEQTLLVTHLKGAWSSIVATFNEELRPELAALWEALQPLAPYLKDFAYVIGVILLTALHTLIALLKVAINIFTTVLGVLTRLATFIVQTLIYAFDQLKLTFQFFIHLFKGEWALAADVVIDKFKGMWEWAKNLYDMVKKALSAIKDIGGGVMDTIGSILPGRAVGGSVANNTPYMVGENGPEMFIPRGNGTIVPNYAMGAGGSGGVTVIVNGDVSGEDLVDKVEYALADRIKQRERV